MFFIEEEGYLPLSVAASDLMIRVLREKPDALFCIATGGSPLGAYERFVTLVKREGIDTSQLRIIKLDEWWGIPATDPSTCEQYIQKRLLRPLYFDKSRYIGFDSMAVNAEEECGRIDAWLEKNGPIDLCILGLGKNGHLGLNEPSDEFTPFCHAPYLDAKTKTHVLLKNTDAVVERGITLGMANLLCSREILMLVTGREKKQAYKALRWGRVTPAYPCTALWLHGNTSCIVDISAVSVSVERVVCENYKSV